MLRSIQRLRGPLTGTALASRNAIKHNVRALPVTAAVRSPAFFKPTFNACQRFTLHTNTTLFKEQEPDVDPKRQMLIGFTCKVCNERSHHTMSKHSYTKGVVLIQCPGCKNRHLIADNLGWFKDGRTTVEDLVKEKGEAIRRVVVDDQGVERLGDLMEWLPDIAQEEKIKKEEAKAKAEELRKSQEAEKDN